MKVTLKTYHGDTQWFVVDADGNMLHKDGFQTAGDAATWTREHYPNARVNFDLEA